MSLFTAAVERLLAESRDADAVEPIRVAADVVTTLAPGATQIERNESVQTLSSELDPEYVERSGWLAITAGAIVESGADMAPLAKRLIECLPQVMQRALQCGELLQTRAMSLEESGEIDDDTGGEWVGEQYVVPDVWADIVSEDPDGTDAWVGISNWTLPAIACLTRDAALRNGAIAQLSAAKRLAQLHHRVGSLSILLTVLDDEPFIVIHPSSGIGFRVRVSGVVDNFQLHTLLADVLVQEPAPRVISWLRSGAPGLPGKRPPPEVAAVARGHGPQQSDMYSDGVWDLYDWRALEQDGTLPEKVEAQYWIGGEGLPADIARFGNDRVILVGPPSYGRTWNSSRYFGALRADVVLEEALTKAAVDELLLSMGRANANLHGK